MFAADAIDVISGSSGWVGAGLLGLVLYWLLMRHLPAKDAQIEKLVNDKDSQIEKLLLAQSLEREKDRTARHEQGSIFQQAISDTTLHYMAEVDKERIRADQAALLQQKEFKEALAVILGHCREDSQKIIEAFRTEIARVVALRGDK